MDPVGRAAVMPYIPQRDRDRFDIDIATLVDHIRTEGELNFVITELARGFAHRRGGNYAAYNATIGVLEAAKLEFYRRKVAPYEDRKIEENGDL